MVRFKTVIDGSGEQRNVPLTAEEEADFERFTQIERNRLTPEKLAAQFKQTFDNHRGQPYMTEQVNRLVLRLRRETTEYLELGAIPEAIMGLKAAVSELPAVIQQDLAGFVSGLQTLAGE
jgi:hypothetical protein